MGTQISFIGEKLRNSYWFVPAVMLLGAALLSWVTVQIDDAMDPEKLPGLGEILFSGGTDGAREVLGTIASSMITVAGVVFSITIVTLQLASTQFGPRMLANFMRDRGNQVTLGTFVASFLYSLLVLRSIRSGDDAVPHLSVTVALALAIGGLSVLIYFIHHVSNAIQAPNLIQAIARELRHGIDHLFPDVDEVPEVREAAGHELPPDFAEQSRQIDAPSSGYIQLIDIERIVEVAREHDLLVRLRSRAGRFVVPNTAFAQAYPADRVTDEVAAQLAGTVVTGARRTAQHDIEFPIKKMVEIAVRALSPVINDPFTACTCVDQSGAGLCEIAGRRFPAPYLLDEDDQLRLVVGDEVTFERLVGGAFDQVRQSADFHVSVYVHLLESLTRIVGCVRDGARIEPLVREARLVVDAAERKVEAEADQDVIEERYDAFLTAVEGARAALGTSA